MFTQLQINLKTRKSRPSSKDNLNIWMLATPLMTHLCLDSFYYSIWICLWKFEVPLWAVRFNLFSEAWGSIKELFPQTHNDWENKPKACKSPKKCSLKHGETSNKAIIHIDWYISFIPLNSDWRSHFKGFTENFTVYKTAWKLEKYSQQIIHWSPFRNLFRFSLVWFPWWANALLFDGWKWSHLSETMSAWVCQVVTSLDYRSAAVTEKPDLEP